MSALQLLDHGYRVTVLAREWASFGAAQRLTSQISGALWEMPSAPCGLRITPANIACVRGWALDSYRAYAALASDSDLVVRFGVRLCKNLSCFPVPIAKHDIERERVDAIRDAGLIGRTPTPATALSMLSSACRPSSTWTRPWPF